jgi:hypothetical protein
MITCPSLKRTNRLPLSTIQPGDCIVERECGWRIKPLRDIGLRHLATLSEDQATVLLLEYGNVELEFSGEPWGHGFPPFWHCTLTQRRGIPWVRSQGHGATKRGALVMALTDAEWAARQPIESYKARELVKLHGLRALDNTVGQRRVAIQAALDARRALRAAKVVSLAA